MNQTSPQWRIDAARTSYESVLRKSAIYLIPLGIVGVLLNMYVSRSLLRALRSNSVSGKRHRLMLNLSLTDTLTGMYLIVASIIRLTIEDYADCENLLVMLEMFKCLTTISPALSYIAQCAFQFLALQFPLRYSSCMSERTSSYVIAFQWIGIVLCSVLFLIKYLVDQEQKLAYKICALAVEVLKMGIYAMSMVGSAIGLIGYAFLNMRRQTNPRKRALVMRRKISFRSALVLSIGTVYLTAFMSSLLAATIKRWSPYYAYVQMITAPPTSSWSGTLRSDDDIATCIVDLFNALTIEMYVLNLWFARVVLDPLMQLCTNRNLRLGDYDSRRESMSLRLTAATSGSLARRRYDRPARARAQVVNPPSEDHTVPDGVNPQDAGYTAIITSNCNAAVSFNASKAIVHTCTVTGYA